MRFTEIEMLKRAVIRFDGPWRAGLVVLLAAITLTGCAFLQRGPVVNPDLWSPRTSPDGPGGASEAMAPQRALRPGDRVVVTLRPSMAARNEIVEDVIDDEGLVTLPLIGEFPVEGLTTSDAARVIAREYIERGFYIDMIVNVINTTSRETAVDEYSITGAIRQRGRFPLREGLTLWQAIIAAGDVTDYASNTVLLTRGGVTRSFSLSRIKQGRTVDPEIRNGDIIQIQERMF